MIHLVVGLLFFQQVSWIPPESSEIKKGIHALYSVKFDSAQTVFVKYTKKYPDRPEGYFFNAMILWVQVLLMIDDQSRDNLFFKKMDEVIEIYDQMIEKNPDNRVAEYYRGGCLGFKARLQGNRKEWLSAANNGRKAYPILTEALDGKISFPDAKFGTGVYKYYAEVIPEKYSILKPVMYFFPKGSREEGINELNEVRKNGVFAKDEAAYFLIQIYQNYENNWTKAGELIEEMFQKYPDNPVFQIQHYSWLIRIGKLDEAKILIENYIKKIQTKTAYYPVYQFTQCYFNLGYIEYLKKNYKTAFDMFEKSGNNYRKNPSNGQLNYYLEFLMYSGLSMKHLGNEPEARKRFEMVLSLEEPPGSKFHDRANTELKRLK